MLFLALGVALLLAWMWSRSEALRRGGWRVAAGLFAVVMVVVGAAVSIRGEWWIGLPLVGVGILFQEGYFRQTVDGRGRRGQRFDGKPSRQAFNLRIQYARIHLVISSA